MQGYEYLMALTIYEGREGGAHLCVRTGVYMYTYVPPYKTYAVRLNYLSETRIPSNRNGVYDLHIIHEIVCQQDFACEYNMKVCVCT